MPQRNGSLNQDQRLLFHLVKQNLKSTQGFCKTAFSIFVECGISFNLCKNSMICGIHQKPYQNILFRMIHVNSETYSVSLLFSKILFCEEGNQLKILEIMKLFFFCTTTISTKCPQERQTKDKIFYLNEYTHKVWLNSQKYIVKYSLFEMVIRNIFIYLCMPKFNLRVDCYKKRK